MQRVKHDCVHSKSIQLFFPISAMTVNTSLLVPKTSASIYGGPTMKPTTLLYGRIGIVTGKPSKVS